MRDSWATVRFRADSWKKNEGGNKKGGGGGGTKECACDLAVLD